MTNNTVTLDLSSGGGRQTLPAWDNTAVEITTTWSNNKTASANSVCNAPVLSIDVPSNFQYNAQALQITASNIPAGVLLSSVSVSDGNTTIIIPAANISMSGNIITIDLIGLNIPTTWNNTTVTWLTTWSDSSTASDTSSCIVGSILYGTDPWGQTMQPDENLRFYIDGCVESGVIVNNISQVYLDGQLLADNTYAVYVEEFDDLDRLIVDFGDIFIHSTPTFYAHFKVIFADNTGILVDVEVWD